MSAFEKCEKSIVTEKREINEIVYLQCRWVRFTHNVNIMSSSYHHMTVSH